MEKNGSFLSRFGLCLFVGTMGVICMVVVFFAVLAKNSALVSPDSMPLFIYPWRTLQMEGMLSGGTFTPHNLYWFLLNPLYAHELTYIIDSLVLALAGVYYLRSQRVHPLAAWCGGLALGLSGYTFTLFSAGHRGYFHMFSCAVWAFGLIARGFETKKLFYFAMVGLVFAWGVPYQPDVLLLVGALAATYVLWRTFLRPGDGSGKSDDVPWKKVVSIWPRFTVSVLVLALAGFGGIRSAMTTQIVNRDAQIAGATGKTEKSDKKSAKMTDEEKRGRWLFATNWSLPPEDVLEFVVPGVFGNDSGQMPYPYWGRLGRPDDSVFQKGRMMPNYRQHTVYLGLIPVLFALFAVFSRPSSRLPTPNSSVLTANFSDVPFWCGVWVACLLLAMGRYTPLYKLFYSIPYMDYIRAPVKFHHLVEVATALLAGFGMDALLRAERTETRRKLLCLGIGMTGLLLVGTLVALVAKPSAAEHLKALGMGQMAEALTGYTLFNFMRAAGLAALVTGVSYVAYRGGTRARTRLWAGCAILALLALDQACVAKRYVRAMNVGPLYQENAVVKAVKKQAGGQVPNIVNYATQNTWKDWFSGSMAMNGIRNLALSPEEMNAPYGQLFSGLQNDPVRLWQVLHAQAVIVPRSGAGGLLRSGVLQSLMDFDLGAGVVRQTTQPGEKTLTLARIRNRPSAPRFFKDWQGDIPAEKQADAVIKGKRTVSDASSPAAAGGEATDAADVRVLSSRGLPGVLATRIKVSAKCPGLLVFDERVQGVPEMLVDGKPVRQYVADAVWPAALVPAGEHEVVLRQQRKPAVLLLSVLTTLVVLGWGAVVMLRNMRSSASGAPA